METNSAANAMQWSIDLEKALRSKTPGRSAEAILEFGPRLQRWSLEPVPTFAAHHMFDLIPGEVRLFANAILLRLADAFRSGDQHTKLSVVKVFLMEYKHRDKRKGSECYKGLLSKTRVCNHVELLSRVKVVFDNGDAYNKALALVLFGCWAHFAKDSARIRYLVLSSLVSSHVFEAKAALFAAGCFCELSDDFPCIVLEMLVNMMTSTETLLPIRLAAARVYAKMGHSYSTATRAYKTGLKLVLDSSEENYQIAMLVSLTKIASTLAILLSDQVGFLFLFLNQEKTLRLRATALKCLRFMFSKVRHFSANANLVKALVSTLDEPLVPASIQCEALMILHKMVLCMLPSLPSDVLDLPKLLTAVENASLSPFMSKSLLALRVLVDISNKFKGGRDIDLNWLCPPSMPSQVVTLIINQITVWVKPLFDDCLSDSVVFQEVNNLFNLLLSIIREHPDSRFIVLDQIFVFLRCLSSVNDHVTGTAQVNTLVHDNADNNGERSTIIRSKLACKVYRFMVTFLENLSEEAGVIFVLLFDKMKLLVENVCECKFFDCYTHAVYSLLLHSPVIWGYNMNKSEESFNLDERSGILLLDYSVERELITIEFARKILAENRNWLAYKVGIYSACQGTWSTSTFIFQQLIMQVHSDSCCCWLKSLFQFAQSEAKVMVLLLTKQDSSLTDQSQKIRPYIVHCDDLGEIGHDGTNSSYELDYSKVLLSAYNSLCSSRETLQVNVTAVQVFFFQRWFLSLRAKALRAVLDVLKTLGSIPFVWENCNNNGQDEKSFVDECLFSLEQTAQVSLRLKRLTKEFDVFSTSFMDIDSKSSKIISGLALSTSLLAFITGFFLFIPNLPDTCLKNSSNSLGTHLLQNLAGRMWHIDHEISAKLYQIINANEHANIDYCNLQSRHQVFDFGCEARDVLNVCRYAVSDIACLRSEAKGTLKEENTYRVIKIALQLLLKHLMKWMQIPFRTPKYFFQIRPCIGSELFAVNVAKKSDEIFVSPGHCLSLSLCLQLRNVPQNLPVRPKKLYSMLYCRVSFQEPRPVPENKEQYWSSYQAWESDDIIEMNERLLDYVRQCGTKDINSKYGSVGTDREFVNTFVCFEPNERGQGFSSCLLDVSRFPIGSYRIKWHSCCVDNHGNYWSLLPLNAGPVFTIY